MSTQSDIALKLADEQAVLNEYRKAQHGSCGKKASEVYGYITIGDVRK